MIFAPFWVQYYLLCFLPATTLINAICIHIFTVLHQTNKVVYFNSQDWQTIQYCQVLTNPHTTNFSFTNTVFKKSLQENADFTSLWGPHKIT
jgi:hypothetical protein